MRTAFMMVLFALIFMLSAPLALPFLATAQGADDAFEVNLLQNPGFEQGLTGWSGANAVLALRDPRHATSGLSSGWLFSPDEEREMHWRQGGISLVDGGRYAISGFVRADAPAVAVLGIDWEDGAESVITGSRFHRGIVADTGWQHVEMEFVAARSGRAVAVVGGIVEGSIWWDDVSLRRVDDRPQQLAARWEERLREHGEIFTGLVVDARGLGVRRAMSPKIFDEGGNIVYAGVEADRSVIIGSGLVSYMLDDEEATKHERLAVSPLYPYRVPLVVTATGVVDDAFRSSVIISRADAERIRRELTKYDFLGRYAVVFVIGDET